MGWFGSSSSNEKSTSDDPLRDLDPELREFLKKESPVKYDVSNPPAPEIPRPEPTVEKAPEKPAPASASEEEPKVPRESLFQDGRYAHLWKTFESQAASEAAGKSDQEKIDDIIQGYKQRKGLIGRAALENCALEHWAVNDCFRNGGVMDTMTMCKAQNRELTRCYNMQSKFLKALGYLSNFDNPQQDEKIQMHADTLYHRMLDREKAIETAKAEGKPTPKFPSLLSSNTESSTEAPTPKIKPSDLAPHIQEQLKERLKGLKDEEREVEERAITDEILAGEKVRGKLGSIYGKKEEEKRKRKEEGKETMTDRMWSIFSGRW